MHVRRALASVGVVAVAAMALAGCGSGGDSASGQGGPTTTKPVQTGGRLAYGIEADPNGLDPSRNSWDPSGILVANAIFDPLGAFDRDGNVHPYLLESFQANADFTEWTVKMRPGVKFHNGSPANAEALKKHVDALVASAITGPAATNIDHVEVVDEMTAKVVTKRPWSSLPALLTGQAGMLAAPEQLADPSGSTHPIGTGPFKLDKWEINTKVKVVRNPDYWQKGLPYLDEVEFVPTKDRAERLDKLSKGTFDVIHASDLVSVERLDALAAEGKIDVVHDTGTTEPNMIMFNTAKAPFDDARLRQGLAYATDLPALAAKLGWPADRLADGPFTKSSPWYVDTGFPKHDPAKAKQLIDAVKAEKGPISFKILTWPDPANLEQVQAIIEQWQAYGLDITIETSDFKQLVIRAVTGNFDTMLFRYFGQPDPESTSPFWISETIRPIGSIGLNFARLGDPAIDEGYWDYRSTADREERRDAVSRIVRRQSELVPFVWLYYTDWVIGSQKSVHDLTNNDLPDGTPSMPMTTGTHRLTRAWIER